MNRKESWREIFWRLRIDLMIFVALVVVAGICYHMVRSQMLKNAYDLGSSLAETYALEEQNRLTTYETLTLMGSESLDGRLWENAPMESIQEWLDRYNQRLWGILGEGSAECYAVIDGKMMTTGEWDSSDYDYAAASWYKRAVAARGDVVFTDVYQDTIFNNKVITVAKKCRWRNTVFAIDLLPEKIYYKDDLVKLPEGTNYFLCDDKGIIVSCKCDLEYTETKLQRHVDNIRGRIRWGDIKTYDTSIITLSGEERGIYYHEMDNGWLSIVTTSREETLSSLKKLLFGFSLVFMALLVVLVVLVWWEWKGQEAIAKVNETNQILGNSYYAIYRINLKEGTYETVKRRPQAGVPPPTEGPYKELLPQLLAVLKDGVREDFERNFSIENIKRLVGHQISDFGGDFERRFDDGYRWVNCRLLYDGKISTDEVVFCFKEVDQEKQSQLQQRALLEASLQSMQKSEESKQAFFRNMSHDMRTPLNGIIGLTDLAAKTLDQPEKVSDYLGKINYSGRQLLHLVNEILEMSRLEQGKVEIDNQQMDIRKCLGDCLESFRVQAQQEKKHYKVCVDVKDPMVMGDASRISQILNNLLSNAFKFTMAGDSVTVSVTQQDRSGLTSYKIVVSDTGIGLSPDFLPQIFDPYAREERFGVKKVTGTGLGMSIVKSLVTQMSGDISVESQLSQGTTFTIILPLTVVKDWKPKEEEKPAPVEWKEEEERPVESLAGRHILLAEDNPINMEIATELLTASGISVEQACNGREAVELFRQSAPYAFDAILMDMRMPEMDGCEATREIRKLIRPDAQTIPIIAVTANAFAEDVIATTEAGMNAHISKPIDYGVLCRVLNELLNT